MKKLCSFIIPTYHRPQQLADCIQALMASASPDSFDVHLYIDREDKETQGIIGWLKFITDLHCIIGPNLQGYASICGFMSQLAASAEGAWKWLYSDDALMEGNGWDKQLSVIPTSGHVVYAETWKLASPPYNITNTMKGHAYTHPCVPSDSCFPIGTPGDIFVQEELIRKKGWKAVLLKGICVNHQNTQTRERG